MYIVVYVHIYIYTHTILPRKRTLERMKQGGNRNDEDDEMTAIDEISLRRKQVCVWLLCMSYVREWVLSACVCMYECMCLSLR